MSPRLGRLGEEHALCHLAAQGYRILCANYRCRAGEVDVVALDGAVLVFVEVKTRISRRFGAAVEAVGPAKQARLKRVAQHFVATRGMHDRCCRFDVVVVTPPRQPGAQWVCAVLQGAF